MEKKDFEFIDEPVEEDEDEGYKRISFEEFIDMLRSSSKEKTPNSRVILGLDMIAYNLEQKGYPEGAFPFYLEVLDWNRKYLAEESDEKERIALENALVITSLLALLTARKLNVDVQKTEELLEEACHTAARLLEKDALFSSKYFAVLLTLKRERLMDLNKIEEAKKLQLEIEKYDQPEPEEAFMESVKEIFNL